MPTVMHVCPHDKYRIWITERLPQEVVQILYLWSMAARSSMTRMARKKGYGQFCPVAKTAEIVAERWTPLIIRELLHGSYRFNELRKGIPLMSPSLLSQRLKELEAVGFVEHRTGPTNGGSEYHLTSAGRALKPVIDTFALWGQRWTQHLIRQDDLDPCHMMWDLRRTVDATRLPVERRTVVEFDLSGAPSKKRRYWLVFDSGEVDLCVKNPGFEVDLYVATSVRTIADLRLGNVELGNVLRSKAIRLDGARSLVRGFKDWFRISMFEQMGQDAVGVAS